MLSVECGAPGGFRTPGPLLRRQLLYPLSYWGQSSSFIMPTFPVPVKAANCRICYDSSMELAQRLEHVRELVNAATARSGRPDGAVRIIGASKTVPTELLAEAVRLGLSDLGENRLQEALPKIAGLQAQPIRPTWHFIGHLQANKAKSAVQSFDIIHSVDSVLLAEVLSRRARLAGRVVPVLLEVNVAAEATKQGFRLDQPDSPFAESVAQIRALPALEVIGLMTVAPLVSNPEDVRPVFRRLARTAADLELAELSMGMTDDFQIAIEEGATMVRIGRAIFGDRPLRPGTGRGG